MFPGRKRLVVIVPALMVLLLGSCLSDQEQNPALPLLTELSFDGAAPESPLVLLFRVDFRDSDGDFDEGVLVPLINGKPSGNTEVPLQELMLAQGLPLDTEAGTLEFVLEVQITPDNLPESGSTFDVGVRVVDGAAHESNTPTVTLEISY